MRFTQFMDHTACREIRLRLKFRPTNSMSTFSSVSQGNVGMGTSTPSLNVKTGRMKDKRTKQVETLGQSKRKKLTARRATSVCRMKGLWNGQLY
jgi:hypothetical protein